MPRYNRVQVGDIYFTNDGSSSGTPCRVNVNGISDALLTKTGQTIISANGTPWTQIVDVDKRGIIFRLSLQFTSKTFNDSIIEMIEDMLDDSSTRVLDISGDLGDHTFNVKPLMPNPVETSGEFSNGILKAVTYSFITT